MEGIIVRVNLYSIKYVPKVPGNVPIHIEKCFGRDDTINGLKTVRLCTLKIILVCKNVPTPAQLIVIAVYTIFG